LTFDEPGSIRVDYAIGVLGTEEQANIAIQLANAAIRETIRSHQGIVLTSAEELLQKAIAARNDRRFGEAENLAGKANEAALAAGRDYEPAQSEIASADSQINQAANEGRNVQDARQLLTKARDEFGAGNYAAARESAEDAIGAIGRPAAPQVPVAAIVAIVVAAAGGVGALVFLKMRKPAVQAQRKDPPKVPNRTTTVVRPPEAKEKAEEPAQEPLEESGAPAEPGMIPESQIDSSVLGRIVGRVLEERPHLRPEDQDVLKYLAEKEGAAFESEIRTKFQLPKTTIWRLVKRLEREELVEIRKAGGQNLIKLKFEDKMP
jgi:uncharacterized membrane protein